MKTFTLLALILSAQWTCAGAQISFAGRFSHGQNYRLQLPNGLWFCLFSERDGNDGGWYTSVSESCGTRDDDFVGLATPPFHGAECQRDRWMVFERGANAPQKVREFSFVLNDQARQLSQRTFAVMKTRTRC